MQNSKTEACSLPEMARRVTLVCALFFIALLNGFAQGSDVTLSGTVISSEDNQPIPGAAVYVEGTQYGTVADLDGNYTLVIPSDVKLVTVSSIGYLTKQLRVGGNNIVFKVISLDESTQSIEDAVVVAFGTTQRKETMISSVESIDPGKLVTPSSNLSTSFAGNIAGVIATQSSGEPGADGASFWIRGISTFGASTEPLYILDGVEINAEILNGIPAESIESFSVLKDAAATALYGSRGANGVMIITTKSGRVADRMSVNVNFNTTVTMPTAIPEVADGVTYMKNFNEAQLGRGVAVGRYTTAQITGTEQNLDPYAYPNVDWYDMMFNDMGVAENLNINVRGGGNRVDYFLNASVNNESGMIKNVSDAPFNTNINAQKYTFQSNVTAKITSTTVASIKMNAQMLYFYKPVISSGDLFYWCMRTNPVSFSPTYPSEWIDADYTVFGTSASWSGVGNMTNPYAELAKGYKQQYTNYLTTSLRVDQDLRFITKGLKVWAQVSFYNKTYSGRTYQRVPHLYTSTSTYDPVLETYERTLTPTNTDGTDYLSLSTDQNGYRQVNLQGNIEYNRTFGKHNVNAVVLYHQKETVDNMPSNYYNSLPKREQGLAGRVSYGYDDRYLIEGNFGYNGSENFMGGKRFGLFPSVAAGWIVSNEKFFSGIKDWFSFLKVRYSFGLSGNDYLDQRFPYISEMAMNSSSSLLGDGAELPNFAIGTGYEGQKMNYLSTLGNEDASWEVSRKHDIGIELGFFDELTIIADFFSEYRDGIFMQRETIPSTVGISGMEPWANVGAVLNMGVDLSADYRKIINRDWTVTARGTFTFAHNEVVENDESPFQQYAYKSQIGKPLNTIYGYVADGLFKDEADIANSPEQLIAGEGADIRPGDIKYKDLNGDGVINENDCTYIGYPEVPEIMYGFGASARWKNLDFSFFFQGRARVSINMKNMHPFTDGSNSSYGMLQWIADDHWSEANPNPDAAYPRLDYQQNQNNIASSSFWVKDGSFLRLKNLEVGYTIKDFARVYCSATNLFILSPFKYWDAEKGSGNGLSYPLQRTVQLGVQFNF